MKDLSRRARKDSESLAEIPDFIFNYADSDTLNAELAEWYTYSEEPEFVWNLKAFNDTSYKQYYGDKKWNELSINEKKIHINRLLNQTDICNKQTRDNVYRSILYLAQGVFGECNTIEEYNKNLVENAALLFESDTFNIFLELFLFEINNICNTFISDNKYAPCISDNADLRVILSILYTLLEVIRCYDTEVEANRLPSNPELTEKYKNFKNLLKNDLNRPLEKTNELFSVYLFQLISKFCNLNIIILPIKKIILMLWKVLLFTLGGLDTAFKNKNLQRLRFSLPLIEENPSSVISQMSPATPPPNPIDLVNELQFTNPNSSYKRKKNSLDVNSTTGLTKQTKGIDNDDVSLSNGIKQNSSTDGSSINNSNPNDLNSSCILNDISNGGNETNNDILNGTGSLPTSNDLNSRIGQDSENTEAVEASTPYPSSNSPPETESKSPPPVPNHEQEKILAAATDAAILKLQFYNQIKTLPWKPKVRLCELESFLDQERKKFLGYGDLINDLETLVGLPYPIHESVKILKQHLYISLAEEQIKLEEKFLKYPLSTKIQLEQSKLKSKQTENQSKSNELDSEYDEDESPAELLFSSLLTNLPQYLICLLKILLTSVPQTRPKPDSLQIMSDLFPEDLLGSHFLTIKLGIDTNRHKEILIKGISAILLLMLKHFKVNHVYQFEFMSQHLLFANCVPLILKFFNLNISSFIQSKNNNFQLDFPNCVIGNQPELDAEELENGDAAPFRWRNVFSCINLLRILNKLTKYKRSRVMMLVIFKSVPILKKILRVKQAMLQLYALKLLKMQTRHLGRQWRKTNMSTISAIYQKVRHRLNDDWAFGNEQETQAWDFQSDECALRAKIDRYNQRKYRPQEDPINAEYSETDNSVFSYLNQDIQLDDNFLDNYEEWLNEEVFSNKIDWDSLLANSSENSVPLILF